MSQVDSERVVRAFMESWETHETLKAGYAEHLAEDCLWENTGLRPVKGREAALALVDKSIETWGEYSVEGRCSVVLASGTHVIVERHDLMKDPAGDTFCDVPIAGVFEVDADGKISRWSDYYDPKPMLVAMNAAIEARKAATDA